MNFLSHYCVQFIELHCERGVSRGKKESQRWGRTEAQHRDQGIEHCNGQQDTKCWVIASEQRLCRNATERWKWYHFMNSV